MDRGLKRPSGLLQSTGRFYWVTLGSIQRGWALAEQGQVEDGVTEMRRALAEYKERERDCSERTVFSGHTRRCPAQDGETGRSFEAADRGTGHIAD